MFNREYNSTNFITSLRAIAIMMVFLIHSGGGGLRELFSFGDRVVDMGKYGVDMFFVISGFTIFYQFYTRNYTIKNFFKVRLLRVSIPYFPLLIFIYIYIALGGVSTNYWATMYNQGEISFLNLLTHFLYISYIDVKFANTIIGVEWTLSIEVFYYILLGVLIANFQKLITLKEIVYGLGLFFIISMLGLYIAKISDTLILYAWLPFKYGYMFLLGGLAYKIRVKLQESVKVQYLNKYSNIVLLFGVISFFIFMVFTLIPNKGIINELFFSLWTFMLIVFVQDSAKLSGFLVSKLMLWLGSISFSMYLLHMIIIKSAFLKINLVSQNSSLNFIYLLFITLFLSSVYYWIFEMKLYRSIKNKVRSND